MQIWITQKQVETNWSLRSWNARWLRAFLFCSARFVELSALFEEEGGGDWDCCCRGMLGCGWAWFGGRPLGVWSTGAYWKPGGIELWRGCIRACGGGRTCWTVWGGYSWVWDNCCCCDCSAELFGGDFLFFEVRCYDLTFRDCMWCLSHGHSLKFNSLSTAELLVTLRNAHGNMYVWRFFWDSRLKCCSHSACSLFQTLNRHVQLTIYMLYVALPSIWRLVNPTMNNFTLTSLSQGLLYCCLWPTSKSTSLGTAQKI